MRLFTPFQHATPLVQLLRRLYAWSVDTLLVCALLGVVLLLAHLLLWGLMQAGVIAAGEELSLLLANSGLFVLLLGALLCGYFLWFWCRSGQTPGLLLARLELQSADGGRLKVGQALVRLRQRTGSPCGLTAVPPSAPSTRRPRAGHVIRASRRLLVQSCALLCTSPRIPA